MKSPSFSKFRSLMDLWEEKAPSLKTQALIETNGLVLFFEKDGKIYGVPEAGRVVFARMKNPEKDSKGWLDDANFVAFDLSEALKGKKVEIIISVKNLDSIKIIDEKEAMKKLSGKDTQEELPDLNRQPTDDPETGIALGEE